MATTDLYTVVGSLTPTRHATRYIGGNSDDGIQVDALIAAVVAGNHTKGTITAWIMVPDDTGTYTIFGAGHSASVEYMMFNVVAGKLQYFVSDGGATRVDVSTTNRVIPMHMWTHVALVQDGNIPRFYVNGVLVTAVTETTNTELGQWFDDTDQINGAHIGAADSVAGLGALTNEFKGYISDFKFFSGTASTAALTADQVLADYNGISNTTSLLAHYKMDGDVLNRANEGTYNGTIVGDVIYCDANEFASRLTFGGGVPVTADDVALLASNGIAFGLIVQGA